MNLNSDIRYLKGIGESKAKLFSKLGIHTVEDLVYYFPRDYENWNETTPVSELFPGKRVCVRVRLLSAPSLFNTSRGPLLRVPCSDGTGIVSVVYLNMPFMKDILLDGRELLFYGDVTRDLDGTPTLMCPKYDVSLSGGLKAVYPLTAGITSKAVSKAVKTAFDSMGAAIPPLFGDEHRQKYRLMKTAQALYSVHFPSSEKEADAAKRTLTYEELFVLQAGLKNAGLKERDKTAFTIPADFSEEFEKLLPFELTSAQKRTIAECTADMKKNTPMRRLCQGDVGSGKTAVAASLIYTAAKNGFQSVLMAPTEVLAQQHKKTFDRFFEGTGITSGLLTGSSPAAARKKILSDTADGKISLLIGTHALFGEKVTYKNLGLCITDEQHRFGVGQRESLRQKGGSPHVLVMSATPIPRTLSMIIYGDLDISVLDEKPAGRQKVSTFCVPGSSRPRMLNFVKEQLDSGHRAFIVCPLVEENDEKSPGLLSAEEYFSMLKTSVLRDVPSALLHGKMKPQQKEEVMRAFACGEIKLLVCTVVIEVGIDVPEANVIVIENAERFGLSQLHQLRGRTGRGKDKSYCILVSDAGGETAKQRLGIMCETDDGFRIAEKDLELRGPGDFFGSRQSGLPVLKLANLMTDSRILYTARDEAQKLLEDDPYLMKEENREIKARAEKLVCGI